jgi:signal transduction histidine kinase/FixJ family two-component response regulator
MLVVKRRSLGSSDPCSIFFPSPNTRPDDDEIGMTLVDSFQVLNLTTEIPSEHSTHAAPRRLTSCTTTQPADLQLHNHQVQFYDDEEHLFKVVSGFFAPFFDQADDVGLCAIIIARPRPIRHLKDLFILGGYKRKSREKEQECGGELLTQSGRSIHGGRHILLLDAHRVLEKLVPGAEINSRDFEKLMSEILSQLPRTKTNAGQIPPSVYAYGEMVDILCERGQHLVAFDLEEIWNYFLATRNISLLCGYRMDSFRDQLLAPVFQQICHSHAVVSPTESYSTLCTVEQQMAMVAALQQNVVALQATIDQRPPRSKLEEQQMRYREQFVDILCHELRNPVSGITGNIELLQTGLGIREAILRPVVNGSNNAKLSNADVASLRNQWAEDTESIDAIAISTEHMKTLTDDLLSLSKLESGKVILENLPFDPKATICSVIKMFSTLAKKKGIQLLHDLPTEVPRIIGDAGRVAQVIINLVSNALKFTEAGSITVGFRPLRRRNESSIFEVSVRDTGKGIGEDEKSLLFRRFAQPISTSFVKYGGSGLGLYISKCLVELMGGIMYVESQRGKGSTFVFTFEASESLPVRSPLLSDDQRSHRNHSTNTSRPERQGLPSPVSHPDNDRPSVCLPSITDPSACLIKQVLLVDDNPINLRVAARLLEAKAISVTTASNGYEAIGKLISFSKSGNPVDMVLMDLDMPFMDGISATRDIRRLNDGQTKLHISSKLSKVPIIGTTGHVSKEKFAEARLAGMDDCIGKPIAGKVLLDLISWVQNRKLTSSPA